MKKDKKIFLVIAIIVLAALSRLVKHPFNFAPVVAMSIFAGAYIRNHRGLLLPILAMALSDIALYQFKYGWEMFDWKATLAVYISIAAAFGVGVLLRKHLKWYTVLGGAIFSSIIFFIITNFAVWAFYDWYPHTLAGFLQCFALAIPFFKNSLAGDVIYAGVFFGVYEGAKLFMDKKKMELETN